MKSVRAISTITLGAIGIAALLGSASAPNPSPSQIATQSAVEAKRKQDLANAQEHWSELKKGLSEAKVASLLGPLIHAAEEVDTPLIPTKNGTMARGASTSRSVYACPSSVCFVGFDNGKLTRWQFTTGTRCDVSASDAFIKCY